MSMPIAGKTSVSTESLVRHPQMRNAFQDLEAITRRIFQRRFNFFDELGSWDSRDKDDWFRAEAHLLKSVPSQVTESNDSFPSRREVPGFDAKDLTVQAEPSSTYIQGKSGQVNEEKKGTEVKGRLNLRAMPTEDFMLRRTIQLAVSALILCLSCIWSIGCSGGSSSAAPIQPANNPVPTISTLSAESVLIGSGDTPLTITGTNFISTTKISFGSDAILPVSATATEVKVVVPSALLTAAKVVPITATNPTPGGGTSNAMNFSIGYPVPTLTAFTASSVLVNTTNFSLEIDGQGFAAGATVHFGPDIVPVSAVTASHLSAAVPVTLLATARVVAVTVTNPEPLGGTSNSLDFTVANPLPTLNALSVVESESLAEADLPLEVTGTNFVPGATVEFGPVQLTPGSPNGNKLDVTIPSGSLQTGGEIAVTVTNPGPGGGASNILFFRLNNPIPQMQSLSQVSALAGDPSFDLTITGAKFVSSATVDFGSSSLVPTSVTKSQMVVNVPEAAFATGGSVQVKVNNPQPGGGPSGTIDFTINNPTPAITSANPPSVTNSGKDVVISLIGSGFVSSSAVTAGTDAVSATPTSKSELQVTVPTATVAAAAASGKMTLSVTNPSPAGGTSNTIDVTVLDKANLSWQTVANATSTLPGTTTPFLIFGAASINTSGMAVFKGTSVLTTSGSGETSSTTGVYTADLANGGALAKVADIATLVPDPNTLTYGSTLAKFGGFPSFPKIDASSSFVGFNATHPPVISLPNDGKAGSAGIYSNPGGTLDTGVGLFVQDSTTTYPYFANPDTGAAFGAFPASPSAVGGDTLVFKADYLNGTVVANGIYYRDVKTSRGESLVQKIASATTSIPNTTTTTKFGYFGAPNAVGSTVVFVGYNKKDAPTVGGIYSAPISAEATLTALVSVGTLVPGETETDTFTLFGDAVSYDGRYIGFWGAWGTDMSKVHITCSEQDAALQAYCLTVFPNGYDAQVPVHQGLFVYDTNGATLTAVAKTGSGFTDFTYWPFIGTLPEEGAPVDVGGGGSGSGGGDTEVEVPLEPPMFVLSPSIVVSAPATSGYKVAFKAKTGSVDGIYMTTGPDTALISTVLDTTMLGTTVDGGSSATSNIKKLDLEREGMRGSWLVIGATMHDSATDTYPTGVYATSVATQ